MLHFPTGIRIFWMRLSVGKSGGLLYMINQRDYSTLYIQQTVTYTPLYTVSSVSYRQCMCRRQQVRDLLVQWDAWNPT